MRQNTVLKKPRLTLPWLMLIPLCVSIFICLIYKFVLTPIIFYNPDQYKNYHYIVIGLNCNTRLGVILNNLDGQYLPRGSKKSLEIINDICDHKCETTKSNVVILPEADMSCR